MAQNTKIEWADHTWNPWIGCTKVGAPCDNCYAEALSLVIHHEELERVCFMATPGDSPRAWERIKANAALIVALRNGAADLLAHIAAETARADAAEARVAELVEGLEQVSDVLARFTHSRSTEEKYEAARAALRRAAALLQEPRP